MSGADTDKAWEQGWRGHEEQQLGRLAALPLVDKLKWLEEAHRVARHLRGNRTETSDMRPEPRPQVSQPRDGRDQTER